LSVSAAKTGKRKGKIDAWMPLYIGDYLGGTNRLTTEQHGAYLLIIFDYWMNGAPPDDDAELSAITRLSQEQWAAQRPKIQRYFTVVDGHWRHDRIDRELELAVGRSNKALAAAVARWGTQAKEGSSDALTSTVDAHSNAPSIDGAMPGECPSPSPSPSPSPNGEKKEANASSVGSDEPIQGAHEPKGKPWEKDADFVAAWAMTPTAMRTRAKSRDKVWPEWRKAKAKAGSGGVLIAALKRYIADDADFKRTGGPGLQTWLSDGRWEHWLVESSATAPATVPWSGPAHIRAAIVAEKGEPFTASWLDRCTWRPPCSIVAPHSLFSNRLVREVGDTLKRLGVHLTIGDDDDRDVDWPERVRAWTGGEWSSDWGPKPGEPGCAVPPHLLIKAAPDHVGRLEAA
jgi:uncharacterized protein YdaU (DUF1376 family)